MSRKLADIIKFSKEELNKIKKDDLIAIIHHNKEFDQIAEIVEIKDSLNEIKHTVLSRLIDENKRLTEKIVEINKNTNFMEKEHWRLNQYTRRSNIEVSGIPNEIKDEVLEETVIKLLKSINVNCQPSDIEACHRLPTKRPDKPKNTIIRFLNQKNAENCLVSRKQLKSVDLSVIDGSFRGQKIFINDNLCPYYRGIYGKCRALCNAGLINSFWSWKGQIFIKIGENSKKVGIAHVQELVEMFPDFEFSQNHHNN